MFWSITAIYCKPDKWSSLTFCLLFWRGRQRRAQNPIKPQNKTQKTKGKRTLFIWLMYSRSKHAKSSILWSIFAISWINPRCMRPNSVSRAYVTRAQTRKMVCLCLTIHSYCHYFFILFIFTIVTLTQWTFFIADTSVTLYITIHLIHLNCYLHCSYFTGVCV